MFKKLSLSILSGLLLFVSWPPIINFTFLIFVSLVPLFILTEYVAKKELNFRSYFGYVYLAFFIFNICTTFWIKYAHFGGAVFAIFCNSFFMTLVFYLYSKIKTTIAWKHVFLILPILWIGFEYLHLNWDLSWPWLTLGNVFSSHSSWIQWYSYTGVLGGTLWIFIVNFLVFKLYEEKDIQHLRKRYFSFIFLAIFLPLGFSYLIYNNALNFNSNDSVNVMVVQPNIDPYQEKFELSQKDQTNSVIELFYSNLDDTLDFLILPETFLIYPIWTHQIQQNTDIKIFKNLIYEYQDLNIILGATLLELSKKSPTAKPLFNHSNQFYKVHNSVIQLNKFGLDRYYKSKLVPGAEQMPFQDLLYPILGDQILKIGNSTALGNFSKQDSISIFSSSNQHYNAPIICYESIYGDYVRRFIKKGAEILFIITNDGWWKKTSGYQQHNIYAKLRAIETRRYIARSANTGISSIINHLGEIEFRIEWDKKDVIQYTIPLYNKKTFYVEYGDVLGRFASFLSVVIILYFFVYNKLRFSH